MWEEGWPLMLMMLPLFGHVWACVGGGVWAGILWEGLGNMWEEGWPMMLMMLPLFGHVWAWACGGGGCKWLRGKRAGH